jgi:aarF domain-containing kinase
MVRACYFWRKAGPIVVHYQWTHFWFSTVRGYAEQRRSRPRLFLLSPVSRKRRDQVYNNLHYRYAPLTLDLVRHLRGLYIKMGQILSSRADFIPLPYVETLSTVQDNVPPMPINEIQRIVREAFHREHSGADWRNVFAHIDPEPLGSASIGQVHRAVLRDGMGGNLARDVAIKVMDPNAETRFRHDFSVFRWLCRLALPGWTSLLDEIERRLMGEFDYHVEANHLTKMSNVMLSSPFSKSVVVPLPYKHLCCSNVLVMEFLPGQKLADALEDRLTSILGTRQKTAAFIKQRSRLTSHPASATGEEASVISSLSVLDLVRLRAFQAECQHIVELLYDIHGYQIFQARCFNGDPHPGNFLAYEPGHQKQLQIGLIDFGQTRHLSSEETRQMAKVIVALAEGPASDTHVGASTKSAATPSSASTDKTVADAMRQCGFALRDDSGSADANSFLYQYAKLFFDSDRDAQLLGFPTPQLYFASLMSRNPLVNIPDACGKS